MKILFLISSGKGKATGGHYYSLHQVSLEMAKSCDVQIVMLGHTLSPVLKDNPHLIEHIISGHSLIDIIHLNKRFKAIFKKFQPDIIHCFDTNSLNRCLLCPATGRIPLILNKCGGPNPLRNNYQHADVTVVFSKENEQWYLNNKHYDNNSIFLIPNRVRALDLLPEKLREEKANPDKITFVRISRLGGAYEMTLLQTFNLIEKLNENIPIELFVIGTITDQIKFNNLVKEGERKKITVHYITDRRAARGSSFLYLADFVVGTGRSFMEATSLGIPTLTPAKNTNIPVLVSSTNVEHFLSTNFSERNLAKDGDEVNTLETVKKLISDDLVYQKFQKETKLFFKELFGTGKINQKYSSVYEYALLKSIPRKDLLKRNFHYLIKFILRGN